ncbi:methionyl-tRNA formyltransferase [Candidatus Magnetomorum sp. HK-1]|nr:methionyl-tRNA formyltransferase [Candidatus Magnetomorum sp. HK-1]
MNELYFNPNESRKGYNLTIFVDNKDSWITPWAVKIRNIIKSFHNVNLCFDKNDIITGDIAFLLGCTKMLSNKYLKKNKLNLVVHESRLPKGRGWSPMAWQILEGINEIPVVLFKAEKKLDEGPIFLQDTIHLNGTELLPEIREKQGLKTVEIVLKFLEKWPDLKVKKQEGEPTYYPKRTYADDQLDVNKTITENFNHLRIVDNNLYPAWFDFQGNKYLLKIYKTSGD